MSDDAVAIKQLENVLALQKKAFLKNQCPSIEERKANIEKIPVMVLINRDAIREALSKDFGSHPVAMTDMVEVLGVAGRAAYAVSKLQEWTKYDSREVDAQLYGSTSKGEVRYQPKGVIGNIVRKYLMSMQVNVRSKCASLLELGINCPHTTRNFCCLRPRSR
jgi:coniferyl-aldehyde dehydrogenase